MSVLSLVIPTKNRPHTAIKSIATACRLGPDVEILVQDCSNDRFLEQLLSTLDHPKLSYVHDPSPPNMSANWNLAVGRITGEYTCFIGDDDGVLPSILELATFAQQHNLDALGPAGFRLEYYWPDFPHTRVSSLLTLHGRPECTLELPDVAKEQLELAKTGGRKYYRVPKLYHSLLRAEILKTIQAKSGHSFKGYCPDFYIAARSCDFVRNYALLDFPLSVVGASKASNTGRVTEGKLKSHLTEYQNLHWPKMFPKVPHPGFLIIESYLHAIRDGAHEELQDSIDLLRVYAVALAEQKQYNYDLSLSDMDPFLASLAAKNGTPKALLKAELLALSTAKTAQSFVARNSKSAKTQVSCKNIFTACETAWALLKENGDYQRLQKQLAKGLPSS